MKQRLAEHLYNLNPKFVRVEDHGNFEPKDLYHERVKILNKFKKKNWKNNIAEMKAQTVEDVVPIFVALAPNLFHRNNVEVTYVGTSNFIMEPIRFVPLYFVVMPHSMLIVTEVPFTTTLAHTIVGMRFKPQIPRGANLVSMDTKMPRKVDMIFVGQPSDPIRGKSKPPRTLRPLGPLGYFELPMVNPSRPPL